MTNLNNIENLRGATLFSQDGEKIGKIGEVYLDDQTNQPTFATVNTGLFGTNESFVPLNQASNTAEGLQVPFTKEFVKDAPNIAADGNLSPEEEQRIYDYYSLDGRTGTTGQGYAETERRDGVAGDARHNDAVATTGEGYAETERRDGVAGDQDVVAHSERLTAGNTVQQRETGRVRLRKHVVTDTETVEVPVRREEVHIEREAIDPNSAEARHAADRAFQGDGEEVVVTTHEERPVVDTEVVATERVSLNKEVHTDTERVSGEVRHEEIVVDEDAANRARDHKGL